MINDPLICTQHEHLTDVIRELKVEIIGLRADLKEIVGIAVLYPGLKESSDLEREAFRKSISNLVNEKKDLQRRFDTFVIERERILATIKIESNRHQQDIQAANKAIRDQAEVAAAYQQETRSLFQALELKFGEEIEAFSDFRKTAAFYLQTATALAVASPWLRQGFQWIYKAVTHIQ
jgi:hypothetical protein